ncbi:unnamed protein product, partial [Polarella glacialis]
SVVRSRSAATVLRDDLTVSVSRVGIPNEAFWRKSGRDVLYPMPSIELTLRKRQALQPSFSAPSLKSSSRGGAAVVMPRIKSPPAVSSPSSGRPVLAAVGGNMLISAASTARGEAWLGLLSGERRVEIPFGQIVESLDSEAYVQWYRSAEADATAEAHTRRERHTAQLRGELDARFSSSVVAPSPCPVWGHQCMELLGLLQTTSAESGAALFLKARLQLYMHLEAQGVGHTGLAALAEALSFRLGGVACAEELLTSP